MNAYGKELILDMYDCDVSKFNRKDITAFFDGLVELLDMEKGDLCFWDDEGVPEEDKQTDPKTTGTSAVQFILTSNITLHTLDLRKEVYLNIFSCKHFDNLKARNYCSKFFKPKEVMQSHLWRGYNRP